MWFKAVSLREEKKRRRSNPIQKVILSVSEGSTGFFHFTSFSVRMTVVCCFLLICLSSCDQVYHLIDKKGAEEKELIGEATPYEKNLKIEEVQTLLKLYGYAIGPIDGVLGGQTRQAIEKFQRDAGLEVTHFVDKNTWARLDYFRQITLVQDDKLNLKLIQQVLQKTSFYKGTIDGKWGVRTEDAVRDFQEAHHLNPDGKIGYQTLVQMAKYIRVKTTPSLTTPAKNVPSNRNE